MPTARRNESVDFPPFLRSRLIITHSLQLDAISFLSANVDRSTPNLRAPPGVKIRSGVVAPITKKLFEDEEVEEDLPDLYRAEKEVDSDEDLVIEGRPS